MKLLPSLLLIGTSIAAPWAGAQPVLVRGQALMVGGPEQVIIEKSACIPAGQAARAGSAGALLAFPDRSKIRLSPGSDFTLMGGVPLRPVLETPVSAPDATSAIKSILTRRDTEGFRRQSEVFVANDLLDLRSGFAIVRSGATPLAIRAANQTIIASDAYFSVAALSPENARVTVLRGEIVISAPGVPSRVVSAGNYAVLTGYGQCNPVATAARQIEGSAIAMGDQAALQLAQTGTLEPVAEGGVDSSKELAPVGEQVGALPVAFLQLPGVGTGPSVPFDLANFPTTTTTTRVRLLLLANPANVQGPVQSPEHP